MLVWRHQLVSRKIHYIIFLKILSQLLKEFQVYLKACLSYNQYCPIMCGKIEAGFWVVWFSFIVHTMNHYCSSWLLITFNYIAFFVKCFFMSMTYFYMYFAMVTSMHFKAQFASCRFTEPLFFWVSGRDTSVLISIIWKPCTTIFLIIELHMSQKPYII